MLDRSKLRRLCIQFDWFDAGTNYQYDKLFEMLDSDSPARELAAAIWICSKGTTITVVESILRKNMVEETNFIMEPKTVGEYLKELCESSVVVNRLMHIYDSNMVLQFEGTIVSFISGTEAGNIGLVELNNKMIKRVETEPLKLFV